MLGGAGLYFVGQHRAGHNIMQAKEAEAKLENAIKTLEQDKAALRDRIALIQQSSQVDTEAYQKVKDDLRQLQQENLELREEVSFYRGIVSPLESSSGIRVDRFNIEKTDGTNLFHYKFVITQVLKNDRLVRGVVKIKVDGVENGRPKQLSLNQVSVDKDKQLEFKFRYFQKFEGDLVLPKGFTARQVLMEVHPYKRKIVKVSYDWPDSQDGQQAVKNTANDG